MLETRWFCKQQHKLPVFPVMKTRNVRKKKTFIILHNMKLCSNYIGDKLVNTKYSSVLGISNIDFTPAEITATGVLPSSVRSDDTSIAAKEEQWIFIHRWLNSNKINKEFEIIGNQQFIFYNSLVTCLVCVYVYYIMNNPITSRHPLFQKKKKEHRNTLHYDRVIQLHLTIHCWWRCGYSHLSVKDLSLTYRKTYFARHVYVLLQYPQWQIQGCQPDDRYIKI